MATNFFWKEKMDNNAFSGGGNSRNTVCLLSIKQYIKLCRCTLIYYSQKLKTIIFPLKKGWKQNDKSPAWVLNTNK